MITRQVTPSESGKRLHRYVRNLMPNAPLGQIYRMIDDGNIRVNGKRKNQNYELASGDQLTIRMDESAFKETVGQEKKQKFIGIHSKIDVVFENHELLVVNKPVGLLTHPDVTESKQTLITQVHAYLYRKGELDSTLFLPASANRLDRNTSGLVLIGKTARMLHQLNQWIQQRSVGKHYVTIVQGNLHGHGEITGSLVRESRNNRTRVDEASEQSKESITRFHALHSNNGYTLVNIELISGRTHQIRSHFQSIGHPLFGDIKYGGTKFEVINHQLLHAWKIVLPDGRIFAVKPPQQFLQVLRKLDLDWQGSS
jgi:RluA family pseudouridine synthase